MIATAFLGSLTFMLGVSRFAHGDSNFNIVSMIQDPVLVECGTWECYVMGLGWVVIGGIGLVVQVCSPARVCRPQCVSHSVLGAVTSIVYASARVSSCERPNPICHPFRDPSMTG
jgi:hypothetical protein